MAYATTQDLTARLSPDVLATLADDDEDDTADTDILTAALEDATAEIDQKLSGRYETPLAAAPEIVRRWCCDLATQRLFVRQKAEMPEQIAAQAELTRQALSAIADGLTGLAGAPARVAALGAENTQRGRRPVFRHIYPERY